MLKIKVTNINGREVVETVGEHLEKLLKYGFTRKGNCGIEATIQRLVDTNVNILEMLISKKIITPNEAFALAREDGADYQIFDEPDSFQQVNDD